MLYSSNRITIQPSLQSISDAMLEVDRQLKEWKVKPSNCIETEMTLEELLVKVNKYVGEETRVGIHMVKSYRKVYVKLNYHGENVVTNFDNDNLDDLRLDENFDPEAEDVVRNILLRATSKRIVSKSTKRSSSVSILAEKNDNAMLINIAIAILLAIVSGLTLRNTLPADTVNTIATNAYLPFYTIFIRCIQIIMAPLVFFSIAYSMTGFSNVGALGRLGGKVMATYIITTMMALLMAIGVDAIIDPSSMGGIVLPEATGSSEGKIAEFSLLDSFISIVPDNFLGSFVRSDMLQIIFLAVLTGMAANKVSKYSERLKDCIGMLNSLFQVITAIITKILPFAVFGAIGNLVMTINIEGAGPILFWMGETYLTLLLMFAIYAILLIVFTRTSPMHFFRHYSKAIITSVSTASSSGTMPVALSCCKNMGISPRIYPFSIPLGTTINMHGLMIVVAMATVFLAKLYGVTMDFQFYAIFTISATLICMATPGVPGAAQAIMLILLNQMGVPESGFLLIVGIIPLLDNLLTCVNVTGDGCVTTLIANNEGLLDKETYLSK